MCMLLCLVVLFFFSSRRRHTRFDCDWSSDVCSSDLGPRPEDPAIVTRLYTALGLETLAVRPGLASPGSIYSSTHGAALLVGTDPEAAYAAHLLPLKLALDVVYVRRASLWYDARIVGRTLWV